MAPNGHTGGAHDAHAGHSAAMLRNRFWISLALTVPILIWGYMLPALFGYARLPLPGMPLWEELAAW